MTNRTLKDRYIEAMGFDPEEKVLSKTNKKTDAGKSSDAPEPTDRHKAALNRAHEMRKFEIENYWKRATYIWAFQAVAFTMLGLVFKDGKVAEPALLMVPAALGALTAFAGWMTAKGSKFWQENWEAHVDMLEDAIEGRLTKVVMAKEDRSYSVTVTNEVLLLTLSCGWCGLLIGVLAWLLMLSGIITISWPSSSEAGAKALGATLFVVLVGIAGRFMRNNATRGYKGIRKYKSDASDWEAIPKEKPFAALYWREPPQGWSKSDP